MGMLPAQRKSPSVLIENAVACQNPVVRPTLRAASKTQCGVNKGLATQSAIYQGMPLIFAARCGPHFCGLAFEFLTYIDLAMRNPTPICRRHKQETCGMIILWWFCAVIPFPIRLGQPR